MFVWVWVSHPCHSEGTKWPWESSRKAHYKQTYTVYKYALNKCSFIRLRALHAPPSRQSCEIVARVLSLLELIAKIFCAVEIARTSAVSGNRHCVYVSIYGIPTSLYSSEWQRLGGCHNRVAVWAMRAYFALLLDSIICFIYNGLAFIYLYILDSKKIKVLRDGGISSWNKPTNPRKDKEAKSTDSVKECPRRAAETSLKDVATEAERNSAHKA